MSLISIADSIHTVKQVAGVAEGEVRAVGATLFVDKPLDEETRSTLRDRLGANEVRPDGKQTRINL